MVCATLSWFCQVTVVLGGTARIKGSNSSWPWAMVTVVSGGIAGDGLALAVGPWLAKSVGPSTAPRTPPTTRSTTRTATRPATTTLARMGALRIMFSLLFPNKLLQTRTAIIAVDQQATN